MAILVDTYNESNSIGDSFTGGNAAYNAEAGQTFNWPLDATLESMRWGLVKHGSPTGTCRAKVYAISGTYGTNAVASGATIAVSDPIDVSQLTASLGLFTFNFTGANRIKLLNGKYAATCEFLGGDASNFIGVNYGTANGHPGNHTYLPFGTTTWQATNSVDLVFYIYKADYELTSPGGGVAYSGGGGMSF